jgi:ATP-dependent RNA helicase SrmB
VEAHDFLLLGKISRYVNEPLKARTIDELRPTTRAPSEKLNGKPSKKVLAKRKEQKEKKDSEEKPRVKKRHRDAKNVGKRRKPSSAPKTDSAE